MAAVVGVDVAAAAVAVDGVVAAEAAVGAAAHRPLSAGAPTSRKTSARILGMV